MIAQTAYTLVRYKQLLEAHGASTWTERLSAYQTHSLKDLQAQFSNDLARCHSIPQHLFELLRRNFAPPILDAQCRAINASAPVSLRVNLLRGTREQLLDFLPKEFGARPSAHCATGIILQRREALFSLDLFRLGWFEMQDEGSQLLADQIFVRPGDCFIDLCAGSGGKSLAIAPKLGHKGQMFLGDIRPRSLLEAKHRLKRAAIQNAQCLERDHPTWKTLLHRADWVLADVPCSGSGTLRRNPDAKEKIDGALVTRCVALQKEIFEEALQYVKPGGHICYATCSLFREENQEQIEHFIQRFPVQLIGSPFQSLITENGPDGFFAAVFRKLQ